MKIYIASDHAGYELKQKLIDYLEQNGIEVTDLGPAAFNPDDDYPDFISRVAAEVSRDPKNARGIVIGLSGQGEAIVANKFRNVRAGVYYGPASEEMDRVNKNKPAHTLTGRRMGDEIVRLLRQHNDANVLSLGAKFLTFEQATTAVDVWIETQFSNDPRHKRRINEIHELEAQKITSEEHTKKIW